LPEHQRVALVLFHFEDVSYQEISERLHASLAKVKTDIRRGRAALLPMLISTGVTP
jgi:RNA polymerase sigma-70 factor (ECF subfamily)